MGDSFFKKWWINTFLPQEITTSWLYKPEPYKINFHHLLVSYLEKQMKKYRRKLECDSLKDWSAFSNPSHLLSGFQVPHLYLLKVPAPWLSLIHSVALTWLDSGIWEANHLFYLESFRLPTQGIRLGSLCGRCLLLMALDARNPRPRSSTAGVQGRPSLWDAVDKHLLTICTWTLLHTSAEGERRTGSLWCLFLFLWKVQLLNIMPPLFTVSLALFPKSHLELWPWHTSLGGM